jgi:ribosome-associated translation inhibitor RaiA
MPTIPLQIKFLNMRRVVSIEREIAARVDELGSLHGRVIGCHVSVELPHKHHQNGNAIEVRISLALPGELVVTRKSASAATPAKAVHQAFDALKRQMRKVSEKRVTARKVLTVRKVARVR